MGTAASSPLLPLPVSELTVEQLSELKGLCAGYSVGDVVRALKECDLRGGEQGGALGALGLGMESFLARGFCAADLRAEKVEAKRLRDAGFTAVDCKQAGYGPGDLYDLCADFPLNEEGTAAYDDQYNRLSILGADGKEILTKTSFGTMRVASWSPDIYAAPPAWDRSEDGYDLRNKHKAKMLAWGDIQLCDDGSPQVGGGKNNQTQKGHDDDDDDDDDEEEES